MANGTTVGMTRKAPFYVDAHQLVFYDVIDPWVASQCSVLSCIAEAGGEARLPDTVTVSDLRNWITAVECTQNVIKTREFPSFSPS